MYLAVDIGGTKTLLAVFTANGEVKETHKFATPDDYDDFVAQFKTEVSKLKTTDFKRACVAVPGKLDRENGVAIAFGNRPWENVPVEDSVRRVLICPVVIENDANLAALSEARLLKNDFRKVLYLTISTGIGGGVVVDGQLDPNLLDSEVGQMLLEYNGELMNWEDFASGRAIAEKFGKKVSEIPEDDNDAWYYVGRNLAIGIVDLSATYTPDVIVIGGGAGAHLELFKDRLDEQLKIYDSPMFTIPPILKAKRPEEAVIYGCYELAKSHHEER